LAIEICRNPAIIKEILAINEVAPSDIEKQMSDISWIH